VITTGVTTGLSQRGQSLPEGASLVIVDWPTSQNSEKKLRNDSESLNVVDVHTRKKGKRPEKCKKTTN